MSTAYEWVVEPVDQYEDVIEVFHADTLEEALAIAARVKGEAFKTASDPGEDAVLASVDVALVRDWSRNFEAEGVEDRQWAYLEDGKLPEEFDGGAAVPMTFSSGSGKISPQEGLTVVCTFS